MRRLRGDQAKLGYASILIQVANFAVLLIAKAQISADEFAFLLTQLAIAGIVGAIATMRFEILIYQKVGRLTRAAALVPLAAAVGVIALAYLAAGIAALWGGDGTTLSLLSIPMMLGLGLSLAQSFLFVQVKRINLLLASRGCQAIGLSLLTAVMAAGLWDLSGRAVLLTTGICYMVPALFWSAYHLAGFKPEPNDPPSLFIPEWSLIKRSLSLTVSTGVNAFYVNLPLLFAAATQTTSFVADFGLILRCFTAPVTFIRQVFGQLFLAEAIGWSTAPVRNPAILRRMVTKTILRSVGLYLLLAPFLAAILYFNLDALRITNFHIIPYLALAVLGQCAINPVSQVRIPLSDERAFLWFDATRLIGLWSGLFILSALVPFELAFGLTALALYASYILFIDRRIARFAG